jgi:hypothetical protein
MAQEPTAVTKKHTYIPTKESQAALVKFVKSCTDYSINSTNERQRFEQLDRAYYRENDFTSDNLRAKAAQEYGDTTKYRNITVPVVMPQVESAVTYQASVFCQGHPIFGVATPPEFIDAGIAMEAIIEDQQVRGGWVQELILFFRDCFKYERGAVFVGWERVNTAELTVNATESLTKVSSKNTIWEGNVIKRISPYNLILDPRVEPSEVYEKGEFAGWTEQMGRTRLKEFLSSLPWNMNVKLALESQTEAINALNSKFFLPQINNVLHSAANSLQELDWLSWAGDVASNSQTNGIKYKNSYIVTRLYARVLPADFNLAIPQPNTPQIYCIILVNDVPVYADLETNAHNYLPILVGSPNKDGLLNQSKSLADNALPFQQVTTALVNSLIASRRRAISDKTLFDPSRVSEAHINSDNPIQNIPVRPAAYGKPLSEAVFPFPFRDDQAGLIMQQVQLFMGMANTTSGQNSARQGQFVKGNKTQSEFETVMSNANGRDQLTALLFESQVFTPIKHILKINILQFQGAAKIFSKMQSQLVDIDPTRLRKAVMEFKISDGLLPTDKLMDSDSFSVALQTIATSPAISGSYNIAPLFSYLIKQRGADISFAEKTPEQVAYEQAVQSWQQTVVEAAKAGATAFPPQPTPEQYGYKPGQLANTQVTQEPARVNNITNNITNNE